MNNTGLLIRQARKEKRITMEELAQKLNVSKSTISKYEHGLIANLKRSKMLVLCDTLDLDPLLLIYGEDTKTTQKVSIDFFKVELNQLLDKTRDLTDSEKNLIKDYVNLICINKGD